MAWKDWGNNPFVIAISLIAGIATIGLGILSFFPAVKAPPPNPPVSTVSLGGKTTLKLRVIDNDSKKAVRDVDVVISTSTETEITDDRGLATFPVPHDSSQATLTFSKDGYDPLVLKVLDLANYNDVKTIRLKKK
jgi:hypothetical protein